MSVRYTFDTIPWAEILICIESASGGLLQHVFLDPISEFSHKNILNCLLTELQLRARQLLDQVEQIQKEQNYQRYREERFRMTSESTNQRVLWWSIAQTIILILTGIWQMRHLKSFFEAKKLV
uniref:GOLD domain-containing protein n=1 Tax=Strigops habroptila TaxID=2489341 RepID=A0A672TLG9_STRHB